MPIKNNTYSARPAGICLSLCGRERERERERERDFAVLAGCGEMKCVGVCGLLFMAG